MSKKEMLNNKKPGTLAVLGRLLRYMFKYYKGALIAVFVCITINAMAAMSSSIFIERLISDVIEPGIANGYDSVKKTMWTMR